MARFPNTYRSQCGGEFGPGDAGYSHCHQHGRVADAPQTLADALDQLADALRELNEINRKIAADLRECRTIAEAL